MTLTLDIAFIALFVAYALTSKWAGLDSRYPILIGILLLVIAAIAEGLGSFGAANTYAEYALFALACGIGVLASERIRKVGVTSHPFKF